MTTSKLSPLLKAAREAAERSAAAQGLPRCITDPGTLKKIAAAMSTTSQQDREVAA